MSPPTTAPTLPAGRRAVLYAVRRRGEATAEQVAEKLDMTVSGARQHLSALAAEGFVEATELAGAEPKRGRKTLLYSVTRAADVFFPRAYGELTNELLSYLSDAEPGMVDDLFAKRRKHRIDSARVRMKSKRTLGAKVAELSRILDEDGYLAGWEKAGPGAYVISEHNCAISAVAQKYGQACTSEIEFIRAVLPGATVERILHMVAGAPRCAYEVKARPATG
jgi:DeoR family suf operon transcriptional repressor